MCRRPRSGDVIGGAMGELNLDDEFVKKSRWFTFRRSISNSRGRDCLAALESDAVVRVDD